MRALTLGFDRRLRTYHHLRVAAGTADTPRSADADADRLGIGAIHRARHWHRECQCLGHRGAALATAAADGLNQDAIGIHGHQIVWRTRRACGRAGVRITGRDRGVGDVDLGSATRAALAPGAADPDRHRENRRADDIGTASAAHTSATGHRLGDDAGGQRAGRGDRAACLVDGHVTAATTHARVAAHRHGDDRRGHRQGVPRVPATAANRLRQNGVRLLTGGGDRACIVHRHDAAVAASGTRSADRNHALGRAAGSAAAADRLRQDAHGGIGEGGGIVRAEGTVGIAGRSGGRLARAGVRPARRADRAGICDGDGPAIGNHATTGGGTPEADQGVVTRSGRASATANRLRQNPGRGRARGCDATGMGDRNRVARAAWRAWATLRKDQP